MHTRARSLVLLAVALALPVARASAQSLVTRYTVAGRLNSGVTFNLSTFANPVAWTAIGINVAELEGTPATLNVYLRPGGWGSIGVPLVPAEWTLAASNTLNSASPDGVETFVPFAAPIQLVGGTTYGVYVMFAGQRPITATPGPDNLLINGAPNFGDGPTTYQDGVLRFDSGTSVSDTFGAGGWLADEVQTFQGTIYYSRSAVIPEPSTWVLLASGLLGIGAVARRRAARPTSA